MFNLINLYFFFRWTIRHVRHIIRLFNLDFPSNFYYSSNFSKVIEGTYLFLIRIKILNVVHIEGAIDLTFSMSIINKRIFFGYLSIAYFRCVKVFQTQIILQITNEFFIMNNSASRLYLESRQPCPIIQDTAIKTII